MAARRLWRSSSDAIDLAAPPSQLEVDPSVEHFRQASDGPQGQAIQVASFDPRDGRLGEPAATCDIDLSEARSASQGAKYESESLVVHARDGAPQLLSRDHLALIARSTRSARGPATWIPRSSAWTGTQGRVDPSRPGSSDGGGRGPASSPATAGGRQAGSCLEPIGGGGRGPCRAQSRVSAGGRQAGFPATYEPRGYTASRMLTLSPEQAATRTREHEMRSSRAREGPREAVRGTSRGRGPAVDARDA